MTFLEAIKKGRPGQIIKNDELKYSFVILINNKIRCLNDDYDTLIDDDMNDEVWELE